MAVSSVRQERIMMARTAALILTLVVFVSIAVSGMQEARSPLSVTFIANEGFMIECGGKKVLIDGLFGGKGAAGYQQPSDSIIGLMKMAEAPFDSIDLIAVTHYHGDHFDAGIAASYLRNSHGTILICTPQADGGA